MVEEGRKMFENRKSICFKKVKLRQSELGLKLKKLKLLIIVLENLLVGLDYIKTLSLHFS